MIMIVWLMEIIFNAHYFVAKKSWVCYKFAYISLVLEIHLFIHLFSSIVRTQVYVPQIFKNNTLKFVIGYNIKVLIVIVRGIKFVHSKIM